MNRPGIRRTSLLGSLLSLVFPWVVLVYPGGFTVFFSLGFTDGLSRFVDIWSYTTVYTGGAFWASYWFWHVTLAFVLVSAALLYLGRWRLGGVLQALAAASLLRFSLGLATHTDAFVVPAGVPWMLAVGAVAIWVGRES